MKRGFQTVALLALSLVIGLLFLGSPPSASAKTRAECEQLEAALRSAISYEVNYTQQQKDEYVARNSAQCNEEARADEAAEAEYNARVDREIHEAEEREKRKEEKRATEKQERERAQAAAEARRHHRQARERREWGIKPTVTKGIAREFSRRLMKQTDFSIWTVDCNGGRINRTHWSCSVHIFYHCLRGRIRVSGAGHKNHRPYYRAKGSELRPCRV
jgi:hypothetical protein